jgi:hypothetical protein
MGTVHVLYKKDDGRGVSVRRTVGRATFREPHDEFFDVLSGPLAEPVTVSSGKARREADDVVLLRKANARLRAIAIELSNLVGDLPVVR